MNIAASKQLAAGKSRVRKHKFCMRVVFVSQRVFKIKFVLRSIGKPELH
jgi:hypothetical protein